MCTVVEGETTSHELSLTFKAFFLFGPLKCKIFPNSVRSRVKEKDGYYWVARKLAGDRGGEGLGWGRSDWGVG